MIVRVQIVDLQKIMADILNADLVHPVECSSDSIAKVPVASCVSV
jgi:hypothetical protein